MAGLLSDAQKASLQSVMDTMHDTFKRPLAAYKRTGLVTITSQTGYSHVYGGPTPQTTTTEQVYNFSARVYYFARHQDKEEIQMTPQDYAKLAAAAAEVRLKVTTADAEWLKDAERVILDNSPFQFVSTPMPHGLFGTGHVTLYLKRTT